MAEATEHQEMRRAQTNEPYTGYKAPVRRDREAEEGKQQEGMGIGEHRRDKREEHGQCMKEEGRTTTDM